MCRILAVLRGVLILGFFELIVVLVRYFLVFKCWCIFFFLVLLPVVWSVEVACSFFFVCKGYGCYFWTVLYY